MLDATILKAVRGAPVVRSSHLSTFSLPWNSKQWEHVHGKRQQMRVMGTATWHELRYHNMVLRHKARQAGSNRAGLCTCTPQGCCIGQHQQAPPAAVSLAGSTMAPSPAKLSTAAHLHRHAVPPVQLLACALS